MWKEFKEFALRGSVMDMAVGVIIGSAFGKVVSSLVADMLMPPIGLMAHGIDFSGLFVNLTQTPYASLAEAKAAGAPTINYGMFCNEVIGFGIIAVATFLLMKQINRLKRQEVGAPQTPAMKACSYCLSDIPAAAVRCAHCTSAVQPT